MVTKTVSRAIARVRNRGNQQMRSRVAGRRAVLRATLGAVGGLLAAPLIPRARADGAGLFPVGVSSEVINRVDALLPRDVTPKRVTLAEEMYFDESVKTAPDASLVIDLRDGSSFELGPDAAIRIDRFIFDPEAGTGEKTVEILHGAFRYVSGVITAAPVTSLVTPHGTLGIRGSVVLGLIDPGTPTFLHVAQGEARFSNAGGASDLGDGQSIAVSSAATPPPRAIDTPIGFAAEALALIARKLPTPAALAARATLPPAVAAALARANLEAAAEQRAAQATQTPAKASAPARSVTSEAPGLATAASTPAPPDAAATLASLSAANAALHRVNVRRATSDVIRGIAATRIDASRLARIAARTAANNPAAAAIAAHAAVIGSIEADRAMIAERVTLAVSTAVPAEAERVKATVAAAKGGDATTPELGGTPPKPSMKAIEAAAAKAEAEAKAKAAAKGRGK